MFRLEFVLVLVLQSCSGRRIASDVQWLDPCDAGVEGDIEWRAKKMDGGLGDRNNKGALPKDGLVNLFSQYIQGRYLASV
jgi:hypothetical protein